MSAIVSKMSRFRASGWSLAIISCLQTFFAFLVDELRLEIVLVRYGSPITHELQDSRSWIYNLHVVVDLLESSIHGYSHLR